ncbi:MAG: adenylyltransferase/cytidyltransferase family protein [Candidatus Micrarchaeia archaeon]
MAFGTFDVLHLGHLKFFEAARRLGSELVVVVARDWIVEKVKGRKPFFSEGERLELVSALKPVDKAVLGCEGNKYEVIKRFKPDVVVLGYDQKDDARVLRAKLDEMGLKKTRVVRLKPFATGKHKSSRVKEFLRKC